MLSISLEDFKKLSGVRFLNVDLEMFTPKRLKGISIDSRTIEPDQIFWAITGQRFDGHAFVKEAQQKSALISVVSETALDGLHNGVFPLIVVPDTLKALQELANLQRKKYDIPVIGITGSNGKTTVKEMLAHILQTKMTVHKTKGNMNNQVGGPLTLLNLNELHEVAVIELGTNQFGEISILTDMTEPNHALITMIGDTHLEFLNSREGVFSEKRALFDRIPEGTIYINLDDPILADYQREGVRLVRYSCHQKADVKGEIKGLDEQGCGLLRLNDKSDIRLQVVGMHNLYNALASAAVALNMNFSEAEIADALREYQATEKRMQVIDWNGIRIVNDTYNANPASMKSAIDTISAMQLDGKMVLVLGDMFELGDQSSELHEEMLNYVIGKSPDILFLMGSYMLEARKRCSIPKQTEVILPKSHEEIARLLKKKLKPGDLLLLKGSRGMQMERVMAYL